MQPDTMLGTVIPVPESSLRLTAICPACRTAAIGFGTKEAIEAVAGQHDLECANLAATRALLNLERTEEWEEREEDAAELVAANIRTMTAIGLSRIRRAAA